MREAKIWVTFDNKQHYSPQMAKQHLGNLVGALIEKHARQLCQITKYTETVDYLENALPDFIEAARIQADMAIENPED